MNGCFHSFALRLFVLVDATVISVDTKNQTKGSDLMDWACEGTLRADVD